MIDQLLDLITKVAWFLFAGYVILIFVRNFMNDGVVTAAWRLFSMQILLPLLAVVSISLLSLALVFVEPEEVGVVISLLSRQGIRERPFSAGLQWVIPLAERVEIYPIYWQTYTMSSKPTEGEQLGDDSIRGRTSDGQEVLLDCSIIFRVDSRQAVRVHIDWQERYIIDLVRPVVRGFVRTQVSQFTVDEVNSAKRKDLEATLEQLLKEEIEDKGLILDQFLLRDITFSQEYGAAIEEKQVALEGKEQRKHEADQLRELAQGRADANVIEAKGQAEADVIKGKARAEVLELVSKVLEENPDLLTHEYIEKLSPQIRVMLVPNNAPLILPLADLEQTEGVTTTFDLPPISPTPRVTPTSTPVQ